jgi:hypothetical protein
MTSVKLTKSIREFISDKIIQDAFKEKFESLNKQANELACLVYYDLYPKKQIQQMEALPKGWLPEKSTVTAQFGTSSRGYVTLELGFEIKVPHEGYRGCSKVYDDEHEFTEKYGEYSAFREEITEQKRKATTKTNAVLDSVTTTNKLRSIWPEIENYIAEAERNFSTGVNLPAPIILDLNKDLNLPRK